MSGPVSPTHVALMECDVTCDCRYLDFAATLQTLSDTSVQLQVMQELVAAPRAAL